MASDPTKPVRAGEELDENIVTGLLKEHCDDFSGDLAISQFPGGASNLTYLLRYQNSTGGQSELVLRRPPFGTKPKSGHDMGREYKIINALQGHFPYVPDTVFYTDDESVMGCEFYIMQRLQGTILRKDYPEGEEPSAAEAAEVAGNLYEVMRKLHEVDYEAAGLGNFGKPEGYVSRQVSGWNGRFVKAHTDDVPDGVKVMQWLEDNQLPDSAKPGIIHNDYKFDNVILSPDKPTELIGVLDWEMATLGDPLMDLGASLCYWVEAGDSDVLQLIRMGPTHLPGMPTRDEIIEQYCSARGIGLDSFKFYRVFGLFRLAVIVQQIYYRFYHKQTSNQKFAQFGILAQLLIEAAEAEMATS